MWPAYGKINTVHWFKVVKEAEGRGLGRALLSAVLRGAGTPIYLHTQASSFRAIKLYTDFGFEIVRSERVGSRKNQIDAALPILEEFMGEHFAALRFAEADAALLDAVDGETSAEF